MSNEDRLQGLAAIQLEAAVLLEYMELPAEVVMINRNYDSEESLREDAVSAAGRVYGFLVSRIIAELGEESLRQQVDRLEELAAELELDNQKLNAKIEKMKAVGKAEKESKNKPKNPKTPKAPKAPKAHKKRRNASSQYRGVRVSPNKTCTKYAAQIFIDGKYKHLGTFDNELIAAAAFQEAAGNIEEAERLRKEAGTDAEIESLKVEKNGSTVTCWECNSCGADYGSDEPESKSCPKCVGGTIVEIKKREGGK